MPQDLPAWTRDELKAERDAAEALFIKARREAGPLAFAEMFERVRPLVSDLLERTDYGRDLGPVPLLENPALGWPLRYLTGPPISDDDLMVLIGGGRLSLTRPNADRAEAAADAVRLLLDPVRFPWVAEEREPTEAEKYAALVGTALLMATERLRTERRGSESVAQEAAVADALEAAGYQRVELGKGAEISFVDDLARGTFTRETRVYGDKCDVPVRLHDGRLLLLECKVSNSGKNSWKRLEREVGGKYDRWRAGLGAKSCVVGAVLAGVFDLATLVKAQKPGLGIFWQHRLDHLATVVTAVDEST